MNIYTVTALLGFLVNFLLGVFVYFKDKKNPIVVLFFTLSLAVAFWCLGAAGLTIATTKEFAMLCDRTIYTLGVFIPTIFSHFVMLLTNKLEKQKRMLQCFYGGSFLFLILSFTKLFIKDWVPAKPFFSLLSVPNFGYGLFCVFFIALPTHSFLSLLSSYRNTSNPQKQNQFFYVMIGIILGFTSPLIYFIAVYGVRSALLPLANIFIITYIGVTAYAIVRHKLMNIEIIVKKTLVFTGLLASVFAMLIVPTLLIQEYVVRNASFGVRLLGLTISGIIIILTMRRIENFIINVTDKYLFQKKYNYKELLKTFTGEVLTVLELDKLVNLTVSKLVDIVKIDSSAILLLNSNTQQFDVVASHNIKNSKITLTKPDGIVTFLEHTHGYLLMSELKEKKTYIPEPIQKIMEDLRAEVVIPMVLHEKVMGILSLGKKKSDENYTEDDLDTILTLARTLAIAISNAQLFEELGKTQAEAAQKEKMAVIGTLSAGINHEICNPLGIARGQCEAFLLNIKDGLYKSKSTDELLQKAQEIMLKVIRETDRATAITKKLSTFAKPAKGEAELVDIPKELDEVFGLVNYELKLEKIEIEKNIDGSLPKIFVDRKQFQEVLFNLLRNAGQAIGDKGKITVTAKEFRGKVTIDIQDTGTGIAENKIKELFNPFFTTKDPGKGTGLGLFIVRQVVEKNGGRIYLKNTKVGQGTTFSIEFPAATPQEVKVTK